MVSRSMQCNWTQALFTLIIKKSLMERMNQYFKDRTENFDDYYPCIQKDDECNLFHVYNWIQFFVSMYNDTIANNNTYDFEVTEVRLIY